MLKWDFFLVQCQLSSVPKTRGTNYPFFQDANLEKRFLKMVLQATAGACLRVCVDRYGQGLDIWSEGQSCQSHGVPPIPGHGGREDPPNHSLQVGLVTGATSDCVLS